MARKRIVKKRNSALEAVLVGEKPVGMCSLGYYEVFHHAVNVMCESEPPFEPEQPSGSPWTHLFPYTWKFALKISDGAPLHVATVQFSGPHEVFADERVCPHRNEMLPSNAPLSLGI